MALEPAPHRWTVDEYDHMGEAGIFDPAARVELLDGEIVEMMAIGVAHAACVDRLTRLFTSALGERAIVRVQGPVVTDPYSEPQPDLSLLVARPDFYGAAHPRPSDILLLVEVSDSTVRFDGMRKLPLYAADGITEAWLVDIPGATVESHRQPGSAGYAERVVARRGGRLAPSAFPDAVLAVDDILG